MNNKRQIFIRALGFVSVFVSLQWIWNSLHDTTIEYAVVHGATVQPAAWLVNLFTPNIQAQAIGFTLSAPGGGLNILNGCEGLEALFLLWAAFIVAPLTWLSRLWGLLLGIVVVFVVNQARILLLFYAYRTDHSWFDPLHATVTPIAVIVLVSFYFYVWLYLARRDAQPV